MSSEAVARPLGSRAPAAAPPAPLLTGTNAAACAHCAALVPVELVEDGARQQFCCHGCRTVFAMLAQHQLGQYYEERGRSGDTPAPALATGRDYAELDDPAFLEAYAQRRGDERTLELLLEGVHCAACVWLVEKLPELVPGVTSCRLDFARRLAYVSFRDSARAGEGTDARTVPGGGSAPKPSLIAQTLDRLGYPAHPYREGARLEVQRREQRDVLIRLAVAGACAGNSMLFALALYSGAFSDMDATHVSYFRWVSLVVSLPSVLWSAQLFYRGAVAAIIARRPHMDLPLSLGIVLAVVCGAFNVVRGHGEIYFDSVTGLVFVLLSARYVQMRQQARAEQRAGSVQALIPRTARRLDASAESHLVQAESVATGERVEVLAGDVFPVDGRVESGSSFVDSSWLSGESSPERIGPGSGVFAGTVNLASRVVVVAEQCGAATRAARVLCEVERASARRAPIAVLSDKVAGIFLVGVLLAAAVAFAVWLPSGVAVALDTAIALLIVTCPCGLALATPLTVSSALGQAAHAGWLIKGGAYLEALARPGLVIFDKTGTLTLGQLSLVSWIGDESLKPHVKALEEHSSHPIARALVRSLSHVKAPVASSCQQRIGHGVEGVVEGRRISVGAVHTLQSPLPQWVASALTQLDAEGLTPVIVAVDGEARALCGLGDPIRPDAAATLARLSALGHRLALLSGDRQAVVDAVVAKLERECGRTGLFHTARGDMTPEAKLEVVEEETRGGQVFMIGDGVNDAAALAAATVGIAVHGGAEASVDAAHAFSTRAGVEPVLGLIAGSRKALRMIHENLAFSFIYNLLAIGLTIAGAISPIWAAVIMPLSSLTVVSHSYRRRMFGGAQ